jgi:hypothetical protein
MLSTLYRNGEAANPIDGGLVGIGLEDTKGGTCGWLVFSNHGGDALLTESGHACNFRLGDSFGV